MVKIFVGNVASATTETELRALFEQHGAVSDCDILKNYGFVHMDNEDEAQNAVSALHKHMVNGSRITVEFATTKVRNATKIYVGKIPEGITVSKIRELFQPFGKVVECDIVKNYAFVHMQRENEALEAISQLKNVSLEGQKIVVSLSCNNQPRGSREDYFAPPLHHYPPYPPPRPPAGDFYAPRGRLPPPPLPPPPPRPYYERAVYERTVHHDPYAAASANYYERDPYERRPLLSHSPSVSSRFYRDRSPLGSHRTLLPPPPPPPPPPASYMRGYARGPVHAAPPPPPPPPIPPASTAAAAAFRRYPPASGYEKDSYEEKYSNGYSASY